MPIPFISVIMPIYNGGEYLPLAVESVLAQALADFELIIIDDGSTDNGPALLESFAKKDARIRLFSQPNRGVTASLNRALAKARGKYLARMDSDDICVESRFALQAAALEAAPELGVLGGAALLINERGEAIAKQTYPRLRDKERLLRGSLLCHPAVMGRAELFRAAGGYREYYKYCEDYDLWLRLSRLTEIDNLPDTLLHYRMHSGNVSSKHAAAQLMGTLIAQGVHLIALRTDKDITAELAPVSAETLEKLPLTDAERKGLYLRLLPLYFRACADPMRDAFVLRCLAWLTPRLTREDEDLLTYFHLALEESRPAGTVHE